MKVYLAIGFLAAYGALVSWGTWQICTGKEAKKDVKVITNEIKNHNADTKALQKHTIEVQTRKVKAQDANKRIERNPVPVDCPVDEFERLWNETTFTARK